MRQGQAIMAEQAETLYVMIQREGLLRERMADMVVHITTITLWKVGQHLTAT